MEARSSFVAVPHPRVCNCVAVGALSSFCLYYSLMRWEYTTATKSVDHERNTCDMTTAVFATELCYLKREREKNTQHVIIRLHGVHAARCPTRGPLCRGGITRHYVLLLLTVGLSCLLETNVSMAQIERVKKVPPFPHYRGKGGGNAECCDHSTVVSAASVL